MNRISLLAGGALLVVLGATVTARAQDPWNQNFSFDSTPQQTSPITLEVPSNREPQFTSYVDSSSKDPFSKDSWVWDVTVTTRLSNQGEAVAGHLGAGYYFRDNLAVYAEAFVGGERVKRSNGVHADGDTWLAGFDLFVRWHFWRQDKWSAFLDAGAGLQETGVSYPADGTNFNFRPQAGAGISYELNPQTFLVAGARYSHVSNAAIHGTSSNPGSEGVSFFVGLLIPM